MGIVLKNQIWFAENTALVADSEGNLRSLVSEWVEYAEEDVNHTAHMLAKNFTHCHTPPHTTYTPSVIPHKVFEFEQLCVFESTVS